MSYSARCMNVQPADPGFDVNPHIAYKLGHRDARHAAAEIAAEADATIAELRREHDEDQGVIRVWRGRAERADATIAELVAALERIQAAYVNSHSPATRGDAWEQVRAALARVKGQA